MLTTRLRAALAAALLAAPAAAAAPPSPSRSVLPFIEDDYPKARAAATAASKPIFLEAWAPW